MLEQGAVLGYEYEEAIAALPNLRSLTIRGNKPWALQLRSPRCDTI